MGWTMWQQNPHALNYMTEDCSTAVKGYLTLSLLLETELGRATELCDSMHKLDDCLDKT